jgi:NADPH:quinone reductase-like Zn-dependent oxidoreductase
MSKAAGFFEPGGPEVVRLVDVPDPEAGPGQVRVRVKTAGVQPFDVAVVAGTILRQAAGVLTVPGNEFAGVVDQVGDGVDQFAPGDEVLGFGTLNAYRELLVVEPGQIAAKPPNMPWEVAGGFTAGAQTADIAIDGIAVTSGETVLIHGAAGAVGAMAVQLCGLRGATVIGVAREAHHDYVRSLGAVPIAYRADFVDQVRGIAPQGIDAAIDGVGGEALTYSLQLVKDRSRILTLTDHDKAERLGIQVTRADRSAARLARLADLYAKGRLTQRTMAVFPLADAAHALQAYQAGNIHGKIVISAS